MYFIGHLHCMLYDHLLRSFYPFFSDWLVVFFQISCFTTISLCHLFFTYLFQLHVFSVVLLVVFFSSVEVLIFINQYVLFCGFRFSLLCRKVSLSSGVILFSLTIFYILVFNQLEYVFINTVRIIFL